MLVIDWAFPSSRFWTCCWHQIPDKPIVYLPKCIKLMSYNIIHVVSVYKIKDEHVITFCFIYIFTQHPSIFWIRVLALCLVSTNFRGKYFVFSAFGDGPDKVNCTVSLSRRFTKKHWWDDKSGVVLQNWCSICTDSGRWKSDNPPLRRHVKYRHAWWYVAIEIEKESNKISPIAHVLYVICTYLRVPSERCSVGSVC